MHYGFDLALLGLHRRGGVRFFFWNSIKRVAALYLKKIFLNTFYVLKDIIRTFFFMINNNYHCRRKKRVQSGGGGEWEKNFFRILQKKVFCSFRLTSCWCSFFSRKRWWCNQGRWKKAHDFYVSVCFDFYIRLYLMIS